MRFDSDRAVVMRPLLAALASVGLFSQLCVSGCAVGPSYRKPATTLEPFHSVAALEGRPTSATAPALETWWDDFNDPMLSRIVQRARDQNLDLRRHWRESSRLGPRPAKPARNSCPPWT
jgi:hypothetical protein